MPPFVFTGNWSVVTVVLAGCLLTPYIMRLLGIGRTNHFNVDGKASKTSLTAAKLHSYISCRPFSLLEALMAWARVSPRFLHKREPIL